jgi:hypothetical protein
MGRSSSSESSSSRCGDGHPFIEKLNASVGRLRTMRSSCGVGGLCSSDSDDSQRRDSRKRSRGVDDGEKRKRSASSKSGKRKK